MTSSSAVTEDYTPVIATVAGDQQTAADTLPLSYGQQRLWLIHQHMPERRSSGNIACQVHYTGPGFSAPAMAAAFDHLIARHESLRTRFIQTASGQEPQQLIMPPWRLTLDVTAIAPEQLAACLAEDIDYPFDLQQGPLLRARVLQLTAEHHVLLTCIHHIVCDGWSLGIMMEELRQFYQAAVNGTPVALAPLPIQYADYALWQRSQDLTAQRSYWQQALAGYHNRLALPHETMPGTTPGWRCATLRVSYPPQLARELAAFCRARKATLFMGLMSGLAVMLQRYTQHDDLCIGTTVTDRPLGELEQLIGFFINVLPLRVNLGGNPSATVVLERVRRVALQGFSNQALPFEQLLQSLQLERDSGTIPLVPVVLRHQNFALQTRHPWPGQLHAGDIVQLPKSSATSELDWQFFGDGEQLELTLEYAAELFSADTVDRMVQQHQQVLAAMLAAPDDGIDGLDLLTTQEHQWHADANRTVQPRAARIDLGAMLAHAATRHPHSPACIEVQQTAPGELSARQLDYAQLDARANQVARRLMALGAGYETRIGLCCERGLELVVGLMAIFKIGACYVPLDPAYPPSYLAQVVDDACPQFLLGDAPALAALASVAVCRLSLQLDAQLQLCDAVTAALDHSCPGVAPYDARQLACLMYTSGSTGKPKGVLVPYAQIDNWLQAAWQRVPFAEDEVMLQKTSISFAVSLKEILSGLLQGVPLVLLPGELIKDSRVLQQTIAQWRVTRLYLVPSHLQALLAGGAEHSALATLRHVTTAGEALPHSLCRTLQQALPWVQLWNNYGCTELNDVSYCSPGSLLDGSSVAPVGYPISNTEVYVLDPQLRQVPTGVIGELYVHAPGMARGYWRQPGLTAQRFIAHPYSSTPGARLYRTGDLMRRLPGGALEFVGREDFEIKVRGHRIDVRQVESVASGAPQVDQVMVAAWPPGPLSSQLVAYVTGAGCNAGQLRDYLSARLPSYMVPTLYAVLAELPRLPNGKLDRKNLPPPHAHDSQAQVQPTTALARQLTAIFEEVLQIRPVGMHDSFFRLGGHSLLAIELIARIAATMGCQLSMATLFQGATVAELVHHIAPQQRRAPAIQPQDWSQRPAPLSFAQERMWFLDRYTSGGVYNTPGMILLQGELHADLLELAIRAVIDRHQVLRSQFIARDDMVEVCCGSAAAFTLRHHAVADAADAADIAAILADMLAHSRPLGQHLPLEMRLCRRDSHTHYLLANVHHIVFDGWSTAIFLDQLALCYNALLLQHEGPAPLPLQYADYAHWERSHLGQAEVQARVDYWRNRLDRVPPLVLPTSWPRPPLQRFGGATVPLHFDRELTEALRAATARHGATLYMGLLAALAILCQRYTGQDDFCIASPVANRDQPGLEQLIGLFVNTQVLRVELQPARPWSQLLEQIKTSAAQAHDQQLPFEKLVDALSLERDTARNPLAQVALNLQNTPAPQNTLHGVTATLQPVHNGQAKFDITVDLSETPDGLCGFIEYATALFSAEYMAAFARHLRTIVAALAQGPDLAPDQLLLGAPSAPTIAAAAPQADLYAMFAGQCAGHPEHPALLSGQDSVSYAQLQALAQHCAGWVAAHGGAGRLVGIALELSDAMLAAVLGVLQGGASYVLLDPQASAEHLYNVLYESQLPLLITRQDLLAVLPLSGQQLLCIDALPAALPPLSATPAARLATIQYAPDAPPPLNGLAWTQAAVQQRCSAVCDWFGWGKHDRFLLYTRPDHPLTHWLMFHSWRCGGSLVQADGAAGAASLAAHIASGKVSVLCLLPHQLPELEHYLRNDSAAAGALASLRWVVCYGTPVSLRVARNLLTAFRAAALAPQLASAYGSDAAGLMASLTLIAEDADAADTGTLAPLGAPLTGVAMQVVLANGETAPPGIPGQLCLAGGQLAQDSWRSGELARLQEDGSYEWLGRIDAMAADRRIDVFRLLALLWDMPGVEDVAITSEQGLTAYLVAPTLQQAQITAMLGQHLPAYAQPQAYVFLPALPRDPHGVLLRQALPVPAPAAFEACYEAPQGALEQALAEAWQQVLKVVQVGRRHNFFDLGGHSVLALQLVSCIRQRLGVEVPIPLVFEVPVLLDMAARIALLASAGATARSAIAPAGRDLPIALAYGQQRLWFIHNYMPDQRTSYNIASVVSLRGPGFSAAALESAFNQLIERHETLRTTFVSHGADGQAQQCIAAQLRISVPLSDATAQQVTELLAAEARHGFDLEHGPLLRARVLRLAPEHHVLLMCMHHIISDGWSLGVMLSELRQFYRAHQLGEAHGLAPLPLQYADYAVWEQQQDLQADMAYWQGALAGYHDALTLPYDRQPGSTRTWRCATLRFSYPPQLAAGLAAWCRAHKASLFMGVTAGMAVVLQRYASTDDVCIGTTVAGRPAGELEQLIGFFINVLPLRVDLSGNPSGAAVLERVRHVALQGYAHQMLPFEHLLNGLQLARDGGRTPLVPVVVRHQNFPFVEAGDWAPGLAAGEFSLGGDRTTPTELDWQFFGDGSTLELTLDYAAELFSADTISRMVEHHQQVLAAMVAAPHAGIDGLEMLTAQERQWYAQANGSARAPDAHSTLVRRFEQAAALHASRPACLEVREAADGAAPARTLSYALLNARANQVVRRLLQLGAGGDSRIGLCCRDGLAQMVGLWAILKLGACCVPLDAAAADGQRQQWLDDASPHFLLSDDLMQANGMPARLHLALDHDSRLADTAMASLDESSLTLAAPDARQLACLMYSNDDANAVLLPYSQLGSGMPAAWQSLPPGPDELMLLPSPLHHAPALQAMVDSLLQGVALLLPSAEAPQLGAIIARWQVTRLQLAPTALQDLLDAAGHGQLATLRQLVVTGAPPAPALFHQLQAALPWVQLRSHYGCAELGTVSDAVPPVVQDGEAAPLAVWPGDHTAVYVLDRQLRQVPVGVTGELYVHTPAMAHGYWRQPALSAQRFVANPYGSTPGTRLYRSGHLARRLAGGALEFIGQPDSAAAGQPQPALALAASPLQRQLIAIFEEVLEVAPVGLDDSFFMLGGHSLLAIQLAARIRNNLGYELQISDLFNAPSVSMLSTLVAEAGHAAAPQITPAPRDSDIPLSLYQERLWFVHQHMPEQRTSYNGTLAVRLRGAIDMQAMQSAWDQLVARHETLRTTFQVAADGYQAVQVIAAPAPLHITLMDASEAQIIPLLDALAAHIYDLSSGPLLIVKLLKIAPEEHVMLVGMHHMIYDAWSLFSVLNRDLRQLYADALHGRASQLPALPIQYADYSVWQRNRSFSAERDYWTSQLAGYQDGMYLPYDFPRTQKRSWRSATLSYHYPDALVRAFSAFAGSHQCTLFMGLVASFSVVLSRYTGRTDLCIGTTTANRDTLELENLIGFFINILALRIKLDGDPDIADIMQRVRATVLGAFEHRALPFEHVLNSLQRQRDSSQIPLVPVVMRHQNFPNSLEQEWNDGIETEAIERDERGTPNEMDWQYFGDQHGLKVTVEYAAELFSAATIERLIQHQQQVMQMMADSCIALGEAA